VELVDDSGALRDSECLISPQPHLPTASSPHSLDSPQPRLPPASSPHSLVSPQPRLPTASSLLPLLPLLPPPPLLTVCTRSPALLSGPGQLCVHGRHDRLKGRFCDDHREGRGREGRWWPLGERALTARAGRDQVRLWRLLRWWLVAWQAGRHGQVRLRVRRRVRGAVEEWHVPRRRQVHERRQRRVRGRVGV
jgi:hypothetical protein